MSTLVLKPVDDSSIREKLVDAEQRPPVGVPVYGRDADDYLRRSAIGENDAVVAECDLSRYACALVTLNGTTDHDDIASHAVIHKARAPDEVLHALHERAPAESP